ncbi:zinc-ribbon domain-containing protein [Labrenzia sp. R4_2]|uniref:zinc-ribbon domain-containing protein n=1 Tax=Labrenzia sp. R4_2 TaxID=2821107 RepID=UPI001AD96C92|nr:zinc-ribbon domain-containing protein [Labrenzia sp. R4_2]MBO9421945.1 zinc-ribbon domain-containing protein [Labrenzia sp. R4_2]
MKITCPDCNTSYGIKPEALGPEGRSVKCAKCGNRWFVSPKDEDKDTAAFEADAAEDDSPGKPAADNKTDTVKDEEDWAADAGEGDQDDFAAEDDPEPVADVKPPIKDTSPSKAEASSQKSAAEAAPDVDPKSADIETLAKRPKIIVNPDKFRTNRIGAIIDWLLRRNYRRIGGVLLLGGALAMTVMLVLMRDTLVKQSPDLASLYSMVGLDVNLRGLEFRNLRTFMEVEDGRRVLVVEGSIRNLQKERNSVPAVRLSIRSADFQEVYAWTVEPRTKNLNALDETRFRTILADPPDGASDIQVRFVDRDQRNIVLE